jgi:hypothetical protein
MDAALQAHLGGADVPGLAHALGNVVEREQIGRAPEVQRERSLREPAEAALERADVGVVDVAVADERDDVADGHRSQLVGELCDGADLWTAGPEQRHELVDAGFLAEPHAVEHLADIAGVAGAAGQARAMSTRRRLRAKRSLGAEQYFRLDVRSGVPRRRPATDEHHFGAVADVADLPDVLRKDGAGVVASESFRVAAIEDREAHALVEPPLRVERELRVHRQPGCQRESFRLRHLAQALECRPRPLRIDVIGRHGRHATPVVDARVEQHPEVVAQVGWRLHMNVGRQQHTRQRDGIDILVRRERRRVVHRGAFLREEVLHDYLLHMSVPRVRLRDRDERFSAVAPVLADADEDPCRERNGRRPRGFERRESPVGGLVGRTSMAVEVVAERLDHHSLAGADRPQLGELVGEQRARVGMGQQACLGEYEVAHRREIVDRRCVAVVVEPLARHRVPVLRSFAQREQRLVATGRRAATGDGDDLFR